MNFFQKNKVLVWVLTGMLIATLSALGTLVYNHWYPSEQISTGKSCSENCDLLTEELGLSAEQQKKITVIRMHCRKSGMAISDSLQIMRSELLTELSKEIPDTVHLRMIAVKIGKFQTLLTNRTVDQYLQISEVCTSEQRKKLSALYFEMMGCFKHGQGKGKDNRCIKDS